MHSKKAVEKISNSIIESYDADRIAIEIGDRYKGRNNNPEKIKKWQLIAREILKFMQTAI